MALIILVKTWVQFTQECFAPSLVDTGPGVLEEKISKCCQYIFAI